MNWLDVLIIVFLGISAFIGSRMGLIRALFPLAIVVLAIFVAGYYYASGANHAGSWMSSPSQAQIVSFIFIFILVTVAALLFFLLLRKLFDLLLKDKPEIANSIIPFVGILIAIVLAGFFYGPVADWISGWLTSPSQAAMVAFLIIFILASAVITRLLLTITSMMEESPFSSLMGRFSGLGGTILGLVIGGLLCGALITIIADFYYISAEATIRNSRISSFLLNNFPFVLRILPKEFDVVRQLFS